MKKSIWMNKFHLTLVTLVLIAILISIFSLSLLFFPNKITGAVITKSYFNVSNYPPQLDDLPNLMINQGDLLSIYPNASDQNNDNLTFYYSSPLNSSGQWQTQTGDSGIYYITVTVSDGYLNSSKNFTLLVNPYCSNLSINLTSNNITANLSWNNLSGADFYNLYYSENLCELNNLNITNYSSSIYKIQNLTSYSWEDLNSTQNKTRYYRISANMFGFENLCSDIMIKHTYDLLATSSGSNDNLRKNWISLPTVSSYDAESFISKVPNDYGIRIKKLERTNASNYNFLVHNKAGPNNFTMNVSVGYEVEVSNNLNYTIVGKALANALTYNLLGLSTGSNDNYRKNWIGTRSCTLNNSDAETFIVGVPNDYGIRVKKLERPTNTTYSYLVHNKLGPNNFTMNLGYGYEAEVSDNQNYTYN